MTLSIPSAHSRNETANTIVTQNAPSPEVMAFLAEQATQEKSSDSVSPSKTVQKIETHGAIVFVGPNITFKIKRPVKFSYMDFSTLEKRHRAIAREYEINRNHAPGIYQGIAAIRKSPSGALTFGDEGEIVEWALRMRSFPQADVLENKLTSAPLPETLTKAFAAMVARYHADAPMDDTANSIAQMRAIIDDLSGVLGSATELIAPEAFHNWHRDIEAELDQCADILRTRSSAGFVRRCHGDLHSGNIVIWQSEPTAFDAIEFDEAIATVDTLYDLAFLLMDLDERGHRAEANLVLAQYLWHTRNAADLDGLRALPMFLSLRAAIRAMVTWQRAKSAGPQTPSGSGQPHNSKDAYQQRIAGEAQAYFSYASSVLQPSPAQLVAVGGYSGTGKSTLAKSLAPDIGRAPGAVHLRSDLERKAMFEVGETEPLAAQHYTKEISNQVYARLIKRARQVLTTGHSVVVDAVFSTPEERAAIEDVAKNCGAKFTGLWLSAPLEVLQHRVDKRTGDASDATAAVVAQQFDRDAGEVSWLEIDASSTPNHALTQARQLLA